MVLTALSLAGVAGSQLLREQPLPWYEAWSQRIERQAVEAGLALVDLESVKVITETFSSVLLDARRMEDYLQGRLPGAMSLPVYAFDQHMHEVLPLLLPDQQIVVYCSGADCDESILLGQLLIEQGFTNLALYAGGFAEWTDKGLPVER